jgi:anti-anti-sigma regulatory factor
MMQVLSSVLRGDKMDGHYRLPALLDGQACAELRKQLLGTLSTQKHCVLDAADVQRVATLGIQLIVSGMDSFRAVGGALKIQNPSPAMVSAFADVALQHMLAASAAEAA